MDAMMWRLGPWTAGAGGAPPPRPRGRGAPPVMAGTTLGPLAPGQRWSVARKREVVLRLMRGEAAELLSRELGLPLFKLEQWRQRAEAGLEGGAEGARGRPGRGPTRRRPAAHRRAEHGG